MVKSLEFLALETNLKDRQIYSFRHLFILGFLNSVFHKQVPTMCQMLGGDKIEFPYVSQ